MEYVLTGKFQTDNLENRFGQYRQMAGGNYNITITQVMESERKLRIKSVLGLHSARYGNINFSRQTIHQQSEVIDKGLLKNE